MKISRNLEKLKEVLTETGNINNVLIVSDCGKESEVIYVGLENVEEVPYFSTMILKKNGIENWKRFIKK